MQFGDRITVNHKLKRRVKWIKVEGRFGESSQRYKFWDVVPTNEKQAIFLGWRTLHDGASWFEEDVGYVFEPTGATRKAALVCSDQYTNPFYAIVEVPE